MSLGVRDHGLPGDPKKVEEVESVTPEKTEEVDGAQTAVDEPVNNV